MSDMNLIQAAILGILNIRRNPTQRRLNAHEQSARLPGRKPGLCHGSMAPMLQ